MERRALLAADTAYMLGAELAVGDEAAAIVGWVTAVDLVTAGITFPRQAIADLRRQGVEVDETVVRGFMAWRLREQLPDQRDAEVAREQE